MNHDFIVQQSALDVIQIIMNGLIPSTFIQAKLPLTSKRKLSKSELETAASIPLFANAFLNIKCSFIMGYHQ